ncbi:MAG: dTDP-4-dehydrorhamnose 3,5-epimerase [Desulfovibrio sp.]
MKIEKTSIDGVVTLSFEPFQDARGRFNRIFCRRELAPIRPGLVIQQINQSHTVQKGYVRGLHFQYPPHAELKIITCIRGSVFDVALDLRKGSPSLLRWHGEILSATNQKALIVPEGCAHGFQALENDVELLYFSSAYYYPEAEGGIRYNDPLANVTWPEQVTLVSDKDAALPLVAADFNGLEVLHETTAI